MHAPHDFHDAESKHARFSWTGEFVIVVVGVLAALWVDDWREARSDRALEIHLLEGIRSDLTRDSFDIASAMQVAEARAAGADELLVLLGDPDAGRFWPTPWISPPPESTLGAFEDPGRWLEVARSQFPTGSISAQRALHMVGATGSLQRIDLSDATFSEAKASGQLDVIQDTDLRARIADYYFYAGRFGNTTDSRVEAHGQDFRRVLAEGGLSATGGASDDMVLKAFRENPRLIAELKNLRQFALSQLVFHSRVLSSAQAVIPKLRESLEAQH